MDNGYWGKTLTQRLSRRRALVATGGSALGAALLAACGGSDSGNGGGGGGAGSTPSAKNNVSSLISPPEDTTKAAKRGGTLKFSVTADIPNFDPQILSFADAEQVLLNYNRLVRVKPGLGQPSDGTIIGDAAESWEVSPDKLTVTMKLRQNLGTPMVAPLNGRNLDSSDILASWERWKKNGTSRSDLANEVNANAPILSLTAPDAKTITLKLKSPISSIFASLANQTSGYFFILPKEGDSGLDLRRTPLGGGSYYLGDYAASSRFVYKRNPNYFDKTYSFADTIEVPIVSEYATILAQLRAGNLLFYPRALVADDIIPLKKDVPGISMYQTDLTSLPVSTFFGFQPGDKTPFRDARLRQAWSMALDRDLFINTFGNIDKFSSQGVNVNSAWNSSVLASGYKGWWLDPKGKDFGPNSMYYQHNIAESKKLLAAAGFASGITVQSHQIGGPDYGPVYPKAIEVMEAMAADAGFKVDKKLEGYTTNWQPEFRDGRGYFDGLAYRLTPYPADPGEMLYAVYNKGGALYYGFDAEGKGTPKGQPFTGDPTSEDLTSKIRAEFDDSKRKSMAQELQKYLAKQMYFITELGAATGFEFAWPAVKNYYVYHTSDFGQRFSTLWVDETQAPLKK